MANVNLVHISDLHFGVEGQLSVWRSLRQYLNEKICPQLVLATGDIVNSPDKKMYEEAKAEIDQLRAASAEAADVYRVCPGNHDRHPLGNAQASSSPYFRS
jgi:3',5'-cyclic AMP phosphodiesterase CpdA